MQQRHQQVGPLRLLPLVRRGGAGGAPESTEVKKIRRELPGTYWQTRQTVRVSVCGVVYGTSVIRASRKSVSRGKFPRLTAKFAISGPKIRESRKFRDSQFPRAKAVESVTRGNTHAFASIQTSFSAFHSIQFQVHA